MARKILDFDKLQKDYLARMLKGDQQWFSTQGNGKCVISDGHFLAILPEELCFVSCEHKHARHIDFEACAKMIPHDTHKLTDTGMRRNLPADQKTTVCILKNNAGEEIWLNETYVKYFSSMTVHYEGTNFRSPVKVMWGHEVVGLILPINHK